MGIKASFPPGDEDVDEDEEEAAVPAGDWLDDGVLTSSATEVWGKVFFLLSFFFLFFPLYLLFFSLTNLVSGVVVCLV